MTSIFLVTEHYHEGSEVRSAWSTREAAEAEVQRLGVHHDIDELLLDIPWGGYDIGPRESGKSRESGSPSTFARILRAQYEGALDELAERNNVGKFSSANALRKPYEPTLQGLLGRRK